jgi:hypothetical protein
LFPERGKEQDSDASVMGRNALTPRIGFSRHIACVARLENCPIQGMRMHSVLLRVGVLIETTLEIQLGTSTVHVSVTRSRFGPHNVITLPDPG